MTAVKRKTGAHVIEGHRILAGRYRIYAGSRRRFGRRFRWRI